MTLPDKVWIRGRFLTDAEAPIAGSVRFTRSTPVLTDLDANIIRATRTLVADLDPTGAVLCQLIVSDDPDILPTGFTYTVRDPLGRSYPMLVPADTPVITDVSDPLSGQRVIELSDVIPEASANAGTVQLVTGPAGAEGPEGPAGPDGPPGADGAPGGSAFVFTQASPSASWVIDHNQGRKLHVTIFDTGERVVYADVEHGSTDQATITFAVPVSGSAVLS